MTIEENSVPMTTEEDPTNKETCSDGLVSFDCSLCQTTFNDRNALYRHRRREHVLETSVTLGEYVIRVPLMAGLFRCPLACCDKRLKSVDTFKKHMNSCHSADVQVSAYDNEHDEARKKRKIMSPSFDLKTGSHLALPSNEQTAYHQTMAINCSPIAMHLNHPSLTSGISAHVLVRNDLLLDVAAKIPFQDACFSDTLECVLQLHDENGQGVNSSTGPSVARNCVYVEKFIASSRLPRLIDAFAFTEATAELIEYLNSDFRISSSLLHAVAMLHTGCVIVDDCSLVFTLTAEVYSRSKSLDAHSETNLKSIPLPGISTYDGLAIGVFEESDGAAAKKKLKIGSKSMNILITMLTAVAKNEVSVGPETSIKSTSSNIRIFYDEAKLKEFILLAKNQHTETIKNPLDISCMRQLTSGFDKTSTYVPWRATLPGFDNDLLQPATVFTVTDLPGNQGYGHGDKSLIKTASSILQTVAIAVMKKCPVHYLDLQQFENRMQQHEDFSTLLQHLKAKNTSDPLDLSRFLLPICKHAAQGLPKANQKIKSNVEEKMLELYGHREKVA